MEQTMKERLVEKGWTEDEAAKAHDILFNPQQERKFLGMKKGMHVTHYWLTIIALTVLNLLLSIVLIPVLIVFKPAAVNIIVLFIGLVFGFLFNFLIRDIEQLEPEHHLIAACLIPITAIINIFILTKVAQSIAIKLRIDITQHPAILSTVYVVAFLSPYIVEAMQDFLMQKGILGKKLY